MRELLIPSMFDRIAGRIALGRLRDLHVCFPDAVVGFLPERGLQQVIAETAAHLHNHQRALIFKFDVRKFFPTCDHQRALAKLRMMDPDPTGLYILEAQYGVWSPRHGGLPQGCPGSPFLSNVVLRDLDVEMTDLPDAFYRRYADDGVIISTDPSKMEDAIARLKRGLEVEGLVLHDGKSQLVEDAWLSILGILIRRDGRLRIPPAAYERLAEMDTDERRRGWHAHYCVAWRWNQFLRERRRGDDIVKAFAAQRSDDGAITVRRTRAEHGSTVLPAAAAGDPAQPGRSTWWDQSNATKQEHRDQSAERTGAVYVGGA